MNASPVNPSISQILEQLQSGSTNDSSTPQPKWTKSIVLPHAQFSQLLQTFSNQQDTIALLSTQSPRSTITESRAHAMTTPAYYANAKYEEISCKAITPNYDGTEENLIPFLTRLDLWHQNEGWAPTTYVEVDEKIHDFMLHFSMVMKTDIETQPTMRWSSPDVHQDKHKVNQDTYNSRLLGMVLLKSVTNDFLTTLLHTIPQLLRSNGTLLLCSICHHTQHNNVAFHESIWEKIVLATLSSFDNNVQK
jgi:hypothetical protein